MAPTIAIAPNGDGVAFGSPGGSTLITTVAAIVVMRVDFGMDLAGRSPPPAFPNPTVA